MNTDNVAQLTDDDDEPLDEAVSQLISNVFGAESLRMVEEEGSNVSLQDAEQGRRQTLSDDLAPDEQLKSGSQPDATTIQAALNSNKPTLHYLFRIHQQPFTVPQSQVVQVLDLHDMTEVSGGPCLKGLTVCQGEILSVVDLSRKLSLKDSGRLARLLVVQSRNRKRRAALLVSAILGTLKEQLEESPDAKRFPTADGVIANWYLHDGKHLASLDVDTLIELGKLKKDTMAISKQTLSAIEQGVMA